MLVSDLAPITDDRVIFSYPKSHEVPEDSGCYVITTLDGTILYIGQSINIRSRMRDHLYTKEMTATMPSGESAYWFYYTLCPAAELNQLEGNWIDDHKLNEGGKLPPFNDVNPTIY